MGLSGRKGEEIPDLSCVIGSEYKMADAICNHHRPCSTVKAPNFGSHGNFGLFLASSVASVDESCTKK